MLVQSLHRELGFFSFLLFVNLISSGQCILWSLWFPPAIKIISILNINKKILVPNIKYCIFTMLNIVWHCIYVCSPLQVAVTSVRITHCLLFQKNSMPSMCTVTCSNRTISILNNRNVCLWVLVCIVQCPWTQSWYEECIYLFRKMYISYMLGFFLDLLSVPKYRCWCTDRSHWYTHW